MPERTCEYDGTPLVYDKRGREDACPTCEQDIRQHDACCRACPEMREELERRANGG